MGSFRLASIVTALSLAPACGGGNGNGAAADAAAGGADAPVSADAASPPDAAPPIDAEPSVDARPANLDCLGTSLPDTAPDPLTITGTVYNPGIPGITNDTLIVGADVESFLRGDETTPIATATSTTGGAFVLSASNGSQTPVNAYVRTTESGYWSTYLYPPTPVFENQTGVQVVMTTNTQAGLLQNLTGVTIDPEKGWVSVLVLDCNGDPVEGATVTSSPAAGDTAYQDAGGVPSTSASATSASGVALLFNVPVGDVELDATVSGMILRANTVQVHATNAGMSGQPHAITTTVIVP